MYAAREHVCRLATGASSKLTYSDANYLYGKRRFDAKNLFRAPFALL
jgi:hypothetical protein